MLRQNQIIRTANSPARVTLKKLSASPLYSRMLCDCGRYSPDCQRQEHKTHDFIPQHPQWANHGGEYVTEKFADFCKHRAWNSIILANAAAPAPIALLPGKPINFKWKYP